MKIEELGTCKFSKTPHIKIEACVNWKSVLLELKVKNATKT